MKCTRTIVYEGTEGQIGALLSRSLMSMTKDRQDGDVVATFGEMRDGALVLRSGLSIRLADEQWSDENESAKTPAG